MPQELLNSVRRVASSPRLLAWSDSVVLAIYPRRWRKPRWHILISPPGGGNIGDQAMVEAFLDNVPGTIVVVVLKASNVVIPARFSARVRIVELHGLIYNDGLPLRFADMWTYHRLLRGARSVALIGGDTMDGAYNQIASVNRANLLRHACQAGVPARLQPLRYVLRPGQGHNCLCVIHVRSSGHFRTV
jgi:hypothetical protein